MATADGAREERVADETILALGARNPRSRPDRGRPAADPARQGVFRDGPALRGRAPHPGHGGRAQDDRHPPLRDRVRFAGTLELTGFDPSLNRRRYQAVIAGARAVLAAPVPLEEEAAWIGFRPLTPDSLPFIGRPRARTGLIIAAGHGMLGFTQSLGTGRLVRELADGAPPSVDPRPVLALRQDSRLACRLALPLDSRLAFRRASGAGGAAAGGCDRRSSGSPPPGHPGDHIPDPAARSAPPWEAAGRDAIGRRKGVSVSRLFVGRRQRVGASRSRAAAPASSSSTRTCFPVGTRSELRKRSRVWRFLSG